LIRLPWSAVVKPAADLARNGFKVNKNLGKFDYLSVFIAIDSTFIYIFNVYM
jgi:gamma-glutamyltranspeptidase